MDYVSGNIFTKNGIQRGYIGFDEDKILETGKTNPPKKPICKGLILPTFINSHTHIGDTFIRRRGLNLPKDVKKLVAPPSGLKHKLLKEVSDKEILDGMKESIYEMIENGISCFCDFRENGAKGLELLHIALENADINSIILSRPEKLDYNKNEIDVLLKVSNGIGLSSISDWDYSKLQKIAKYVKSKNKLFAIHASERCRENIDLILDLKPDLLIHMIYATGDDLEYVKDNDIPIIICPRSNNFFNLKSDFRLFKEKNIDLLIGTDNSMLNSSNVLDEIKYLKRITNEFSDEELLYMITYGPRKALNLEYDILGSNSPANFVVLDGKELKILYISVYKKEG
jgi:cytosine/adenosine deaminase-related metal-dependent hydrolase